MPADERRGWTQKWKNVGLMQYYIHSEGLLDCLFPQFTVRDPTLLSDFISRRLIYLGISLMNGLTLNKILNNIPIFCSTGLIKSQML
jgi:hypothetical protein